MKKQMQLIKLLVIVSIALVLTVSSLQAEVKVTKCDEGAVITIDGKPFTTYRISEGTKPYLWPVIGPTGKPITRAYPMENVEGESKDHPHHRSL